MNVTEMTMAADKIIKSYKQLEKEGQNYVLHILIDWYIEECKSNVMKPIESKKTHHTGAVLAAHIAQRKGVLKCP